jgi:hypothetical protein
MLISSAMMPITTSSSTSVAVEQANDHVANEQRADDFA